MLSDAVFSEAVFSEAVCARDFELGQPRGAFVFGGRGQTNPLGILRLETERGAFAIRRSTAPPRRAALAVERAALAAGIPMLRPMLTASGAPAASYQSEDGLVWVRVSSWVDGAAGQWGQVSESASFEVAQIMARIHTLPVPAAELAEEPWRPPGEAGWRALYEAACARRQPWGELLLEKVPLLVAAEAYLECRGPGERSSPSQRDYHPPNLITPPVGPRVLIDWEAAGPAVARKEALKFALIWATPEGGPPARELVQAFVRGYRGAGGVFEQPSLLELVEAAQPPVWWIWFNVQRDLSDCPGSDPELVPALLSGVKRIDGEVMKARMALFR